MYQRCIGCRVCSESNEILGWLCVVMWKELAKEGAGLCFAGGRQWKMWPVPEPNVRRSSGFWHVMTSFKEAQVSLLVWTVTDQRHWVSWSARLAGLFRCFRDHRESTATRTDSTLLKFILIVSLETEPALLQMASQSLLRQSVGLTEERLLDSVIYVICWLIINLLDSYLTVLCLISTAKQRRKKQGGKGKVRNKWR